MYDLPPPPDYAEYDDAHRRDSGIYSTINESEQGKLFIKSYIDYKRYGNEPDHIMTVVRVQTRYRICKFINVFV